MLTSKSFLELLRQLRDETDFGAEMEVRSYSGRGMFGSQCIGVVLGWGTSTWTLALALADLNNGHRDLFALPAPLEDSMGRGSILYWPNFPWPKGEEGFGGED